MHIRIPLYIVWHLGKDLRCGMRLQDLYHLRDRQPVRNTGFHVYMSKIVAKRQFSYLYSVLHFYSYLYSVLHFYFFECIFDYFLCSWVLENSESVLRHKHNVLKIVLEVRYILIFCLSYIIHVFTSVAKIRPRKAVATQTPNEIGGILSGIKSF